MSGSKIGWIITVVVWITLIAVIWFGITQIKSDENVNSANSVISSTY